MEESWKDLFSFNKRERNGIFVLCFLIFLVVLFQQIVPFMIHSQTNFDTSELDFLYAQIREDSIKNATKKKEYYNKKNYASTFKKRVKKEWSTPHKFNPNDARVGDWLAFGLSNKQVQTILNYLNKGGVFRIKSDVSKMYVVSEEMYTEMHAFLLLPDSLGTKNKIEKSFIQKKNTTDQIVIIELNSADTTQLIKLRGIGSYYARQIIYYRDKLGGFVSISQLYEIERMREETVQKIEPFLTIDTTLIRKLHINSDDASVLVRHPYITWNMAKNIQEHRQFEHKFKSISDLVKYGLLTEELYSKLVAYLEL